MQIRICLVLIFIIISPCELALAQSNANAERKALHAAETTDALFIHFNSKNGFIYKTIGLPLIGEHYPFQKKIPEKILVEKYGPNTSVSSIIIPEHFTENANFKTFYGISQKMGKIIWLGCAALFGFIAVSSKNLVSSFIGKNHPALNNLFWYGFTAGFVLGIFINFHDLFGENQLIYFDNANNARYRIVVNKDDGVEIGAKENIGAYLRLGWNDLEIYPASGSDNAWYGKIFVEKPDGYLVYNINGKNQ